MLDASFLPGKGRLYRFLFPAPQIRLGTRRKSKNRKKKCDVGAFSHFLFKPEVKGGRL